MKKIVVLIAIIGTLFLGMHASDALLNPFISGNTFKAIANHCFDETTQQRFDPKGVRPYDIIFVKTDYILTFFEEIHPNISSKYILLTHNSDYSPIFLSTNNKPQKEVRIVLRLDDPTLVVWFAQNIDYVHPKLKPLPIGIANSGWAHGNIEMFKHAIQNIPPLNTRQNKVYLNFTEQTNVKERAAIARHFKTKPFVFATSFKEPKRYLEELKLYRYVISPPGNGFDCHRTWEALLMGCIPLVQHSLLDPLFEGLPVILIDRWSDITPDFLEKKFHELQNSSFTLEKMFANYWIQLIKSYQLS